MPREQLTNILKCDGLTDLTSVLKGRIVIYVRT